MSESITIDDSVWRYLEKGSQRDPFHNPFPFLESRNEYCELVYNSERDNGFASGIEHINVRVDISSSDSDEPVYQLVGCLYRGGEFRFDHANPYQSSDIFEKVRKGIKKSETAILARIAERKKETTVE